ncbi:PREDICTED: mRNAion factor [Prunus dulcis]|uniref:PREDICTED: mRNAion factor n=1 Tax=Prunus dulcis TaxID=3755 RepID=A0A5E4EZV8_PRUDU|nr:transcription factor bHLH131 [Prunus dulcis]KAI5324783.1 hypothetical protein L3X38_033856 [Prunus dulcis]VVA21026.1 PREDICTED: mRNAion factor [Prunus dulcis]
MLSIPSYYPKQISFPKGQGVFPVNTIYSKSFFKPKSKAETKVIAAKKHSDSERRRRMRINGQYATLRTVLPNLIKMDKASVLAETVRQVRELKRAVAEVEAACRHSDSDECVLPGGVDKLSLEECDGEQEGLVKATLSCDDRPGLISDMTRALSSVKGRVVRAEMVIVGGRSKNVLWIQRLGDGKEGMVALRRALKVVIDRPIFAGLSKRFHLPQ